MPDISLLWLALLGGAITVFLLQCLLTLNMKIDSAWIFSFCLYFDLFGYFSKLVLPGPSLFVLLAVPLLPVALALLLHPELLREIFVNQGVWLWGVFLAYMLVTLLWAPADSGGLMKEFLLVARGIVPAIYMYILYLKDRQFSWSVVAWAGLAYALGHLLLGVYSAEYPGRLTLPGSNPIFNARASLITATICLWAGKIPLLLRLLTLGAALASALATESRGPLVAFLVANGFYLCFSLIRKYREKKLGHLSKWTVPLLFLLLATGGTATFYAEPLSDWVESSRFMVLFDRNQLQGDDNYIGRMDLQTKAMEKLEDSPFLGAGLGSVTPPLARDFPHNLALEIGAEGGFLGLALWTLAVLFSLLAALRQAPVLAILLVQAIAYAMASGDFGYNFEYVMIAFAALMLLPARRRERVAARHEYLVCHYRV